MTTIETARLLLRPWQPDDLDQLLRLYADPVVMRIISVTHPDNAPSRRVMEKIGLVCQGLHAFRESEAVWYALDRATWERTQTETI